MATELENLKILSEKLPTRCEVCHKTDQYCPETNTCLRCLELNSEFNHQTNCSISEDENDNNHNINENNTDENTIINQNTIYLPTQENTPEYISRNIAYTRNRVFPSAPYNVRLIGAISAILLVTLLLFFPAIYVTAKKYLQSPTSQTSSETSQGQLPELEPPIESSPVEEKTPQQVELDLQNPQDNPPIVLSVNNTTVVELQDEIVSVINGNDNALKVDFSPSSNKRLYFTGKEPMSSGNVILEFKNKVFTISFGVRDTHDTQEKGFNGLVKIKKQS